MFIKYIHINGSQGKQSKIDEVNIKYIEIIIIIIIIIITIIIIIIIIRRRRRRRRRRRGGEIIKRSENAFYKLITIPTTITTCAYKT